MIDFSIPEFKCVPNTLPPEGGGVSLSCKVDTNLSHLRIRFWIADDSETRFAFRTGSGMKKEIFVPSRMGKIPAPSSNRNISPAGEVRIVAIGDTTTHHQPLKVHVEVTGFFAEEDTDPALDPQGEVFTITINTLHAGAVAADGALTMALKLVNKDVGVSQRRLAEILSSGVGKGINVSEFMVSKVIQGGSSADLLKTLRGK